MGIPTKVESLLVILTNTIGLVNLMETQMMIMMLSFKSQIVIA